MRSRWSFAALLSASLLISCQSWAAGPTRPCKADELKGDWELVSVVPVLDAQNATFFPYQRFTFLSDGQMKYMTSMSPFTAEEIAAFDALKPVTRYSLEQDGTLVTTRTDVQASDRALCSYVIEDPSAEVLAAIPEERHPLLPLKGNVTLAYYDAQGNILCQKVLKRT